MRIRWILVGLTTISVLGACGSAASAAPAAQTAAPASAAPASAAAGATAAPSTAVAPPSSPAVASAPAGGGAAGDPELAARFPTQVGGKPVVGLTTANLAAFYTAAGFPADKLALEKQELAALGVDLGAMTFGDATATVGGNSVSFQGIRAPGMDAARVAQGYLTFADHSPGDVVKAETLGGKSIYVVRNADGYGSVWLYPSGDTLWFISVGNPTTNQDAATAIFAALP